MRIDIDPIDFEGGAAPISKRRWMLFLAILGVAGITGLLAVKKHRQDQAEAIFKHPITTTVTPDGRGQFSVEYNIQPIGQTVCFDLGGIRLALADATLAGQSYYYGGSSSGSFNIGEGITNTHQSSSAYGTWELYVETDGAHADISLGPIKVTMEGTIATVGDRTFDVTQGKTVVVLKGVGAVSEVRVVEEADGSAETAP